MASFKVILVVCIIFATYSEVRLVSCSDVKCECGAFKYPTAETTMEEPVIKRTPNFQFECDADGKESCSNMCKALAGSVKPEGPGLICEILKDNDTPFKPSVYYKACNDNNWTFTGLISTLEICCKAGQPVPCT